MKKTTRFFLTAVIIGLLLAINSLMIKVRRLQREVPVIEVEAHRLEEKLNSPAPEWVTTQIRKDLERYVVAGISAEMLDDGFYDGYAKEYNLARFHIKNRHVTFSIDERQLTSRQFSELLAAIQKLNQVIPLPDVDFIVSLQDGFDNDPTLPICPWFVFSKTIDNTRHILIPDFKALTGYSRLRQMIQAGNAAHPWREKEAKAFWRGSTAGGFLTASTWNQIARSQLVLLSLKYPGDLDARFNHVIQCSTDVPKIMKNRGMVSGTVSRGDHLTYKYLVDVDGNSCSFERCFWLLLSNSLVIKQQSPNIQWYYGALEPYKHYLPIKQDLTDLKEKIEWARQHDDEAQKIAMQASQFVEENLSNEDILVYFYHLLKAYAALR